MAPSYLIDGYNLLYAMGAVEGRIQPPGVLEKARLGLLGQLHAVFGDSSPRVTVVFDAAGALRKGSAMQTFRGLHVLFAVNEDEADDLIEKLIKKDATPKQLVVVSDDHRLQQAGRRRHCHVQGCQAFLDWLDHERRQKPAAEPAVAEKVITLSDEEMQHWLAEFADLDNDPAVRELRQPFDLEP